MRNPLLIRHLLLGAVACAVTMAHGDDLPASQPATVGPSGAPMRPGRLLEAYGEIFAGLKLTPDQAEKIRSAIRQTREQFRERSVDRDTAPAERVQAVRDGLRTLDEAVNDVLTGEQREQFADRSRDLREWLREQLDREAQRPATSRPATRPAYEQRPGAPTAGRVERAIVGVGLTDNQRNAIFDILDPARDRIDAMVAEATQKNVPAAEVERRVRAIVEECYAKVGKLLVQEQKERFEAQFRADRVTSLPPLRTPPNGAIVLRDGVAYLNGNAGDAMTMAGGGDDMMTAGAKSDGALPRAAAGSGAREPPATQATAAIRIGDLMPNFTLTRLNGADITQRVFTGRPTVFIFGSLTAPSFRDRMPKLEQLARSTGGGVMWAVIYTREMNPGVGDDANVPERNRDEKIAIAEHQNLAERAAAARMAKDKLGISFEVIPDSMGDELTNRFGAFPNGAAVFDASGKLVALERWAEPFAIKRALDRARARAE